MKRSFLVLLLFTNLYSLAQSPIQTVMKNYFRTNPFEMKFSSFLLSIQKDPWFTTEELTKRTDSNFFYLTGSYKYFNPFHFTPRIVRLIIAESEINHVDSLNTLDTIINMQLSGILDSTDASITSVKKEFKRFDNNFHKKFSDNKYTGYDNGGKQIAEINTYFYYPFSVSPITIAWGRMPDTKEYTFTITIRFKVKQNLADLIIAPGGI